MICHPSKHISSFIKQRMRSSSSVRRVIVEGCVEPVITIRGRIVFPRRNGSFVATLCGLAIVYGIHSVWPRPCTTK